MTGISGQQSERNLVNAVKKYAPIIVNVCGQRLKIVDAKQLGGGNPEPKADIALITKDKKEIGISMKKPNFGFFEAWMDENKLDDLLSGVGLESAQRKQIISGLKGRAKEVSESSQFKTEALSEYNSLLEILGPENSIDSLTKKPNNKFKVSDFSITETMRNEIKKALLKDKKKRFGKAGEPQSTFKVENVYSPLNQLLGEKYKDFLKTIIGGSRVNPFKAEYIIVETATPNLTESKLISIIQSAKSLEDVVNEYAIDDSVNIKFRLRPITITRAAYSKTNAGKYRKGSHFYADENIGVSWTVHVTN
jgi:hypothetical protein